MAGGRGGLGIVMGPGGGFVLMWPVAAFVIGFLYERSLRSLTVWKEALILVLGGIVLPTRSASRGSRPSPGSISPRRRSARPGSCRATP